MSRTQSEEDRRMEKFEGVCECWERGELTQGEAAESLGRSERQVRRYVDRYEAEGLEGLRDGRLGRASGKAIEAAIIASILSLYRQAYAGWNVKHFHEHLLWTQRGRAAASAPIVHSKRVPNSLENNHRLLGRQAMPGHPYAMLANSSG